jgi:hypothetical protein
MHDPESLGIGKALRHFASDFDRLSNRLFDTRSQRSKS